MSSERSGLEEAVPLLLAVLEGASVDVPLCCLVGVEKRISHTDERWRQGRELKSPGQCGMIAFWFWLPGIRGEAAAVGTSPPVEGGRWKVECGRCGPQDNSCS